MDDETELLAILREAAEKRRGYASFFGWSINRDVEEWGVVQALAESLEEDGLLFFSGARSRGRPNDPPDCEALDSDGRRIAIEVTELVDCRAIQSVRNGKIDHWAAWTKEKFLSDMARLIVKKDDRFPTLKERPYEGGYVIVVYTDEPTLTRKVVARFLAHQAFDKPRFVDRAFLLLSYDPDFQRCPYFELAFHS